MATISTRVGNFNVVENKSGNGSIILSMDGKKVCETDIVWWDKDALVSAIESNHVLIEEKLKEIENTPLVTKENAMECLEGLVNVLGESKNKGFYTSRLKQCINKLKSA